MVLIMLCGALPENDISCLTFDAFLSLIYSSLVCHLYFPLSVFLSLPSGLTQKIVDAAFLYTWIIYIYTRRKNISTGRWQADNIQVFDCYKKRTHKCYRKIDKQSIYARAHTYTHTCIRTNNYKHMNTHTQTGTTRMRMHTPTQILESKCCAYRWGGEFYLPSRGGKHRCLVFRADVSATAPSPRT